LYFETTFININTKMYTDSLVLSFCSTSS
jgi:hypothetical protein